MTNYTDSLIEIYTDSERLWLSENHNSVRAIIRQHTAAPNVVERVAKIIASASSSGAWEEWIPTAKAVITAMGGGHVDTSGQVATPPASPSEILDNKCPDCGAEMIEVCSGLEGMCKSQPELVNKALENASYILANFKPEGERDKQAEWEGCYALLFKQLNDAVQEIYRLQDLTKPVSVSLEKAGKASAEARRQWWASESCARQYDEDEWAAKACAKEWGLDYVD